MSEKYVKLKHVKELLKLIEKRDEYPVWSDGYDKYDRKVKVTIEWLELHAKDMNV